jgi:hypothetical protein
MNDTGRAIAYASRLYRQRAETAYAGYAHRDPMALLRLSPGGADPYLPGLSRAGAVRRRSTTTIRGPARLPVSTGRPQAPQALIPAGTGRRP